MYYSSSDSDDDCFKVCSKLHKLKDKYQDDKLDTAKLLNESGGELDLLVSNLKPLEQENVKKAVDTSLDVVAVDAAIDLQTVDIEHINEASKGLDEIIKKHNSRTRSKRVTRSSARLSVQNNVENIQPEIPAPVPSVSTASSTATTNNITRGRGRGRGRRSLENAQPPRRRCGRRNRNHNNYNYSSGPIYSVGNTDDYPDMSDNVQLFSNNDMPKNNDVVFVEVPDSVEHNEEMSVKVYWQNNEFVKFMIRKFQKISQIFDYFSKRENVNYDHLLFTYNEKILKPDDTPDSLGYRISKFIDGGIVNQNITKLTSKNSKSSKNCIKIKFQCQNVKRLFETDIGFDEKFLLTMMKYAEHIEKPLEKLKFEFDGDSLSGNTTPRQLELEGGECIDVKILS